MAGLLEGAIETGGLTYSATGLMLWVGLTTLRGDDYL